MPKKTCFSGLLKKLTNISPIKGVSPPRPIWYTHVETKINQINQFLVILAPGNLCVPRSLDLLYNVSAFLPYAAKITSLFSFSLGFCQKHLLGWSHVVPVAVLEKHWYHKLTKTFFVALKQKKNLLSLIYFPVKAENKALHVA